MRRRSHPKRTLDGPAPSARSLCEPAFLPPVGTRIQVDAHLADDGGNVTVEVTEQQWDLRQEITEQGENQIPSHNLTVKTRSIR